ncbi:helix-turn-helix domain-containing protein [Williamsia sterculiae]|uniref:HTH cro/C1-type domain-containing protein n=1 Tax=Williamsia sterculiae TaxID=1344003 RepID=A0A1N7FDU7_9NOCA|nr:helix-turn-helix transcriptional regulator [Williamsia sterculiae]SIR98450.1 hypothetical protein SAMN05445060_1968 [Williamsia sterculiae]
MSKSGAPSLAQVIGGNAAELRGNHSSEELSVCARRFGLKWNTGRVSDLESGKISPTVTTLFALSKALTDLTGAPVSVADLVRPTTKWVEINDQLTVRAEVLVDALSNGSPLANHDRWLGPREIADAFRQEAGGGPDAMRVSDIAAALSESEVKLARSMGLSRVQFVAKALDLWGQPFGDERDARAGADASPQKRGRVARVLKQEMTESTGDGDD